MMSVDPVVPDLMNGQAWNPYSYVISNPLALTDTNGYCFLGMCTWGRAISTFFRKFPILGNLLEIAATLDKEHGLIGVKLPTLSVVNDGCAKPDRLQDNINSGYAVWAWWENITATPAVLSSLIEQANAKSKILILNSRARRVRNG